jgi:hypothetical protein
VFAPMPRASTVIETRANAGLFHNDRIATRRFIMTPWDEPNFIAPDLPK